ncbi:hypothetical protein RUM44_013360 [Polyplax serrata]|uniref:Uncharacterized protein n=1 Tax=Polyplax serrata TaxID=468196 RepID=A0ABR1BI89_POLSC
MISLPPLSAEYQYEEDVDSEWEDFNRLMTEYRLRHGRMVPQASSLLNLKYAAPARKAHAQTSFYPCPPSALEDEKDDPLDYIGTAVRIDHKSCSFNCENLTKILIRKSET